MNLSDEMNSDSSPGEDTGSDGDDVKETLEEIEAPRPKKPKFDRGKDRFKQPTTEELNNLKEAETLFLSSLFRMQSEELLKEVKIKDKWRSHIDTWLVEFKKALEAIKPGKKHDLSDQTWLKKSGIQIPLIQEPFDVNGVFLFEPPANIDVVGSYRLDLVCLPDFVVDLVVEIPAGCWQHGDFLNHRYHRKRSLYLACLANKLKNNRLVEELKFAYQHDDHMRPTLLVKPSGKAGKHCYIQVLPCPPHSFFKISRFGPARNNVRPSWYFGTDEMDESVSTPHYNGSVLVDVVSMKCLQHQQEFLKDSKNLRDGILFLKVWLRKRELSKGFGSFSGFIATMLVSYLVTSRKISRMMSSYQVMRNALLALSETNWTEQGISSAQDSSEPSGPSISDFHDNFDVVFVDPSGFANLCANVSKATYDNVRHEARLGIQILDTTSDSFETLFMKSLPMCEKFDHHLYLERICGMKDVIEQLGLKESVLDFSGNLGAAVLPKIVTLLQKGVGKRIILAAHRIDSNGFWSIKESPPNPLQQKRLTVGLLINAQLSTNVLEKGPQADASEAKEFREFWGEKSELRRFQDGSICETVVFGGNTSSEKQLVIERMTKYILQKHATIPESCITYVCNPLESLLSIARPSPSEILYGTGDKASLSVIQSYSDLAKILHKINSLPLSVTSVQGISAVFRFTEVFPALPNFISVGKKMIGVTQRCMTLKTVGSLAPQYIQPLEIVVQFEGSGKWPDNIDAIRRLKAAFHIQLSKVLHSDFGLVAIPLANHVDVMKDGYIFRIIVASTKEIMLLKQVKGSDGIVKLRETEESQQLRYTTLTLPQISSSLHGLQQQHNLYGISTRLAKRWVASHLLSDYMGDLCIELLVANLFLNPYPFSVPGSAAVAFLRFLKLLSTNSWKTTPLIINMNGELKREDYADIQSHFSTHRPTLPPMFIATPFDKLNSECTRNSPSGTILHRLVLLAAASLKTLEEQLLNPFHADFKIIFRPPMDPYDAIIHLKPLMIPKRHLAVDVQKSVRLPFSQKNESVKNKVMPVVDFDPVSCYLQDLRDTFEEFALFFYDCFGGSFIGVIWKPKAFESEQFKVSHINARMVMSNMTDISPNVEAILENFAILGSGIVKQIETKTNQWTID